jgi:hypothetical protein
MMTSVNVYQTTRRHIPEDGDLHSAVRPTNLTILKTNYVLSDLTYEFQIFTEVLFFLFLGVG